MNYNATEIVKFAVLTAKKLGKSVNCEKLNLVVTLAWADYYRATGEYLFVSSIVAGETGPVIPAVNFLYGGFGGNDIIVKNSIDLLSSIKTEDQATLRKILAPLLEKSTAELGVATDELVLGGLTATFKPGQEVPFEYIISAIKTSATPSLAVNSAPVDDAFGVLNNTAPTDVGKPDDTAIEDPFASMAAELSAAGDGSNVKAEPAFEPAPVAATAVTASVFATPEPAFEPAPVATISAATAEPELDPFAQISAATASATTATTAAATVTTVAATVAPEPPVVLDVPDAQSALAASVIKVAEAPLIAAPTVPIVSTAPAVPSTPAAPVAPTVSAVSEVPAMPTVQTTAPVATPTTPATSVTPTASVVSETPATTPEPAASEVSKAASAAAAATTAATTAAVATAATVARAAEISAEPETPAETATVTNADGLDAGFDAFVNDTADAAAQDEAMPWAQDEAQSETQGKTQEETSPWVDDGATATDAAKSVLEDTSLLDDAMENGIFSAFGNAADSMNVEDNVESTESNDSEAGDIVFTEGTESAELAEPAELAESTESAEPDYGADEENYSEEGYANELVEWGSNANVALEQRRAVLENPNAGITKLGPIKGMGNALKVLKIVPRREIHAYEVSGTAAIIAITSPDVKQITLTAKHSRDLKGVLYCSFYDSRDSRTPNDPKQFITEKTAEKIAKFVIKMSHKAKTLIIESDYGLSRSAGVLAGIYTAFDMNGKELFLSGDYCPDALCYTRVLDAFGIAYDENVVNDLDAYSQEQWLTTHECLPCDIADPAMLESTELEETQPIDEPSIDGSRDLLDMAFGADDAVYDAPNEPDVLSEDGEELVEDDTAN